MIGLFQPNIYFLSVFTVIYLLSCLYLTLQVYYMGCWSLGKIDFVVVVVVLVVTEFCAFNLFRQELVLAHVQILRLRVLVGPSERPSPQIPKSHGIPNNREHKQLAFGLLWPLHRTKKLCSLPAVDFHGKHPPLLPLLYLHESCAQGTY